MGALETALLAVALGVDTFSVCVGIGLGGVRRRTAARLAALFGVVPGVLLALGSAGAQALHALLDRSLLGKAPWGEFLHRADPAVLHAHVHGLLSIGGALVLTMLALELIRKAGRRPRVSRPRSLASRAALALVVFSVSTDALAAGLGLGVLDGMHLPLTSVAVAAIISLMAAVGLGVGAQTGPRLATWASLAGGLILIGLALRLVWWVVG